MRSYMFVFLQVKVGSKAGQTVGQDHIWEKGWRSGEAMEGLDVVSKKGKGHQNRPLAS